MKSKKRLIITMAIVVIAISFLVGITAIAAQYGSSSDPLVSLSYLTDVYTDQVLTQVDSKISTSVSDMTDKFNEKVEALESQISNGMVISTGYTVVTLTSGQKLIGGVGTELMLRTGTATACSTDYSAIIDTTSGSSIAAEAAIQTNHICMVTIAGNGITATAGSVKVLVRGEYSIT